MRFLMDVRRSPVITINDIWFSLDGSVPDVVVANLLQMVETIRLKERSTRTHAFFWTDKDKLDPEIKIHFESAGIKIKDYRYDVSPQDEKSKDVCAWVKQFIDLATSDDKAPFAIASDLLRMYLLFVELPLQYPGSVNIYKDCNDIILKELPGLASTSILKKIMHGVAFRSIEFNLRLLSKDKTKLFNNDLIITCQEGNEILFQDIFSCLHANFVFNEAMCQRRFDMNLFELYRYSQIYMPDKDKNTAISIVFSIAHPMNYIYTRTNDYGNETYLMNLIAGKKGVDQYASRRIKIGDTKAILDMEFHPQQGKTWAPKQPAIDIVAPTLFGSAKKENKTIRKFWNYLFINKYAYTRAFVEIRKLNLRSFHTKFLHQYPQYCVDFADGFKVVAETPESLNIYTQTLDYWHKTNATDKLQWAVSFAKAIYLLNENELLESKYSDLLRSSPEFAIDVAKAISQMKEYPEYLKKIFPICKKAIPKAFTFASLLPFNETAHEKLQITLLCHYVALLNNTAGLNQPLLKSIENSIDRLLFASALSIVSFKIIYSAYTENFHDIDEVLMQQQTKFENFLILLSTTIQNINAPLKNTSINLMQDLLDRPEKRSRLFNWLTLHNGDFVDTHIEMAEYFLAVNSPRLHFK